MTAKSRTSTAIRFPPELHRDLVAAAEEFDLPINRLVVEAVKDFLPRVVAQGRVNLTP